MSLKCGIVGLPNVGKSTLFNALTKAGIAAENYPFCTIEPNTGVVEVPDPRLQQLAAMRGAVHGLMADLLDGHVREVLSEKPAPSQPAVDETLGLRDRSGGDIVVLMDASEVYLADDGQVTVDASDQVSLEMSDAPAQSALTGGGASMVSMWQSGTIAMKAERYINWAKRRSAAVAYADNVHWGE